MSGAGFDADLAIVGAGGAGLTVVMALDAALAGGVSPGAPMRIVLVDPQRRDGPDRTWCLWDGGTNALEPLLHRTWERLELLDREGTGRILDVAPMRYVMLRSQDLYVAAEAAIARLGAVRVTAPAHRIEDGPQAAVVHAGGREVRARWVLDSRPAAPGRAGSTMLLQHFRGWTVRLPDDLLDPALPTLMDFSTPQPARGVSFAYCLPLDRRRALVEYTEFSPQRLESPAYDVALEGYLQRRWGLRRADVMVEAVEDGTIPMTDAAFARRAGRRVFRIGTAGGATRPSTGYTFAAMQRQAAGVAAALLAGAEPLPPAPYPPRHRLMDAVLLRALDRGYVPGPELFVRLFDRNPPQRVLRFLDGATSPAEEIALMATAPWRPMIRAGAEDAAARIARRLPHRA